MYGLTVDKASPLPIIRQLTGQLREQILTGALPSGTRLPPSRGLAVQLQIARNTVMQVYDQLIAEGYLSGHVGSGTYVVALNRENVLPAAAGREPVVGEKRRVTAENMISFDAGTTDFRHFPRAAWTRALRDACADLEEERFAWCPTEGEVELRKELCAYLYRSKDIACKPEQLFIVPGATNGVDLLAWALKGRREVAMEDPCVYFMRHAFERNGYQITPVPVDEQGMRAELLSVLQGLDFVYVVPSHQFPTGNVLPIRRRLALLNEARRLGAYIIEDDYDSEFRYTGEPIQTLRHLDSERVIYLGSFSKIFMPTLRIGYMILPWELIGRVRAGAEALNQTVPVLSQRALASFLKDGQMERHIYKMKKIYARKRLRLMGELREAFGPSIRISGENAGMHMMVMFDRPLCREDFSRLDSLGVEADWAEDYAQVKGGYENAMVLGYGALTEEQIALGVKQIREVLE